MTTSLPAVIVCGCDRSFTLEQINAMPPKTHLVNVQRVFLDTALPASNEDR